MKPMIGITCNIDKTGQAGTVTSMGLPSQAFHLVADDYVRAVENAGGIPVLIPLCGSFETVKALLDRVDGVLLTGGNDVDPTRYGEFIQKRWASWSPSGTSRTWPWRGMWSRIPKNRFCASAAAFRF